jgi:hypothetical protein
MGRGRVAVPSPSQLTGVIRTLMDDITGGDPNRLSRYMFLDQVHVTSSAIV